MPDITMIREAVLARQAEIERMLAPLLAEAQQLKAVLAGLEASSAGPQVEPPRRRGPGRAAAASGSRRSGVTRGGGTDAPRRRAAGTASRAEEALARISAQPGITAVELARAMGIAPNYLYRVLPRLEREGKVAKRGKGYLPVGGNGSAS